MTGAARQASLDGKEIRFYALSCFNEEEKVFSGKKGE